MGWINLVAESDNGLEGAHGGNSVVFLFALRQVTVGHQAGMGFFGIVALETVGPAFGQALGGLKILRVLRQPFG